MDEADKQTEIKRDSNGRFLPGNQESKGREVGSKNKFTNLKKAFLDVFDRLGGTEELLRWAAESKRNQATFYQWITKMLPSTTGIDDDTRQMLYEISERFLPEVKEGENNGNNEKGST